MAAENRAIWHKSNGTWKKVNTFSVNQGGNWVPVTAAYYNDKGLWKQFYPSGGVVNALSAGTYNWVVPPGVNSVTVDMVGGGGGGGTAEESGSGGGGGGGGSGGYYSNYTFPTVPGETLYVTVGAGGGGGLTSGTGSSASGINGSDTTIVGQLGTITASGGTGALGGGDQGGTTAKNHGVVLNLVFDIFGGGGSNPAPPGIGGLGGTGGLPGGANGVTGESGQSDSYSGNGGAGGGTPFGAGGGAGIGTNTTLSSAKPTGGPGLGYGSGGGGAGFRDRTNPYGWSGGDGKDGGVQIRWNNGTLSTFLQPNTPTTTGTVIPNKATLTPSLTTALSSTNSPSYSYGIVAQNTATTTSVAQSSGTSGSTSLTNSVATTVNQSTSQSASIASAIAGMSTAQIAAYMDAHRVGIAEIAVALNLSSSDVQSIYNSIDPNGPYSTAKVNALPTTIEVSPPTGNLGTVFTVTLYNGLPGQAYELISTLSPAPTGYPGNSISCFPIAFNDQNGSTELIADASGRASNTFTGINLTKYNYTSSPANETISVALSILPITSGYPNQITGPTIALANGNTTAPAANSGIGGSGGSPITDLSPIPYTTYSQTTSYWNKSSRQLLPDTKWRNWGLFRSVTGVPNSGWGVDSNPDTSGTVNIPLSGNNVDVVILDLGSINPNHPEFAVNASGGGGSRAVPFNWFVYNEWLGLGSNSVYNDTSYNTYDANHAAHCAGISAGNTYGWARSANIYSLNYTICPGGATAQGLANAFDYIRAFHVNKPVNPATNRKNPTVVNCSDYWFKQELAYSNIVTVNYRGTTYNAPSGGFNQAQLQSAGILDVAGNGSIYVDVRNSAIDAAAERCIAAGVTVVSIAGNYGSYIDVPGGQDYNNYFIDNTGAAYYYHRGASPGAAPGVICVGNMGSTTVEQKSTDSGNGPRVDIFAPGTSIISSVNTVIGATRLYNINAVTGNYNLPTIQDPRNPSFYISKDSGTSMAAPQVTGYIACMLEKYPTATPSQVYNWVISNGTAGQLTSTTAGYGINNDLNGAPNLVLHAVFT